MMHACENKTSLKKRKWSIQNTVFTVVLNNSNIYDQKNDQFNKKWNFFMAHMQTNFITVSGRKNRNKLCNS